MWKTTTEPERQLKRMASITSNWTAAQTYAKAMHFFRMATFIVLTGIMTQVAAHTAYASSPHSPHDPQHGFSDFESLPDLPPEGPDTFHSHQNIPLQDTSISIDEAPKGLFRDITLAEGFEEDLEFRRGHGVYPVGPTNVFSQETVAVFVVFRVHKHYAAYEVIGRLYPETADGLDPKQWIDEDAMYLALEDESGYLKLFPPSKGWQPGRYRVEIYVGYEVSALNRMGTMRFTIQPSLNN